MFSISLAHKPTNKQRAISTAQSEEGNHEMSVSSASGVSASPSSRSCWICNTITSGYSLAQMELDMKQAGYTDAQIATAKQYYTEQETLIKDEGKEANFSTYFEGMLNSSTMSEIHSILNEAEQAVLLEGITAENMERLNQLYIAIEAKTEGKITAAEFNERVAKLRNGTYVEPKSSDTNSTTENNAKAIAGSIEGIRVQEDAKVIDVNKANALEEFGKYVGSNNADSKQNTYLNHLIHDAKSGLIEVGQMIIPNYGSRSTARGNAYVYVGNGIFVEVGAASNYQDWGYENFYIPRGYKENWLGNIKEK